jgi:hypothetical protein
MKHAKLTVETLPLSKLKPHPKNPREHPEPGSEAWETLKKSIADVYFDPLVWNRRNGRLISGHLRRKVLAEMQCERVDCVVVSLPEKEHVRLMLRANTNQGEWITGDLAELLKGMDGVERLLAGFDLPSLTSLGIDFGAAEARKTLAEQFIVPPFSVLDARQGYWQERKKAWMALGIQSELGRGGGLDHGSEASDDRKPQLLSQSAAPGGSARPACDYSKRERGDGHGRAIK